MNIEELKTKLEKGETVTNLVKYFDVSEFELFGYIKKLKDEGNNIYLITSRNFLVSKTDTGNGKIDITKKWLENNDICYDKLVFSPHDKIPDIKKLNVDIMIEDSPINIESISKIIPVIAFDTRYNKDTKSKYRCYSWYDIYKTLTEYKK